MEGCIIPLKEATAIREHHCHEWVLHHGKCATQTGY